MYRLREEPSLLFDILWAMDSNDSLKRIIRRYPAIDDVSGIPGPSSERTDTRHVGEDMYISREDVNKWAQEAVTQAKVPAEGVSVLITFSHISLTNKQHTGS
jgi:hypothetical protein